MEWVDEAVVLGTLKHGETSVILEALTREHGRHLGLVHGGRSRRMRPCLQRGNGVTAVWRSRLEEQLGTFAVEPRVSRAAQLMESRLALHVVNHLCALARLLPERDPHPDLYDRLAVILDRAGDRTGTPALVVHFELALLTDLGFGLDLDRCVATGTRDDLVYVSPKSGRAVSRMAGEPFRDRMLPLPAFLRDGSERAGPEEVEDGFRLLDYFVTRDLLAPRGLAFNDARRLYRDALRC